MGSAALGRAGDNVYVNAATGNLVISNQDEFLIGLGPDSAIGRAYNSLGAFTDDNGDNWRPTTARQVQGLTGTVNTAGSTVTRVDWDGSEVVYTYDTTLARYVSKAGSGAYDTILYSGGVWSWIDGNSRVTETYNASNRIATLTDPDGNALTFTYTGSLLTRVTTASGEYTDLTWSGNNLTQMVTTKSGGATLTRVRYGYDASNRLTTVTVDLSPTDNSIADGKTYVTTYSYDGTSKRVASIAQTDGTLLQIGYVLVGADYRVQTLTQTVGAGDTRVTSFSYDTTIRVTTITDPLGVTTALTYDTAGQLTQISSSGVSSSFGYNANGDVTSVTDGGGKVTTYQYDASGNLTLERDAAGNTVTRTFGSKNELLTETRYLVPDPDGAGAGQPGTPIVTRYAYDAENHLRFVVNPDGEVTEYEYNAAGQLISTVEYPANAYGGSDYSETGLNNWANAIADKTTFRRTDTTYDFRGNVATVTSYSATDSSGAGSTAAAYSRTTYIYDQFGKLLSRLTNGSTASEVFVYDGLGRLISSTDMANATTNVAFNDAAGTTVVTLANGLTQTSVYNRAGEKIAYTESTVGLLPSTFDAGLSQFTSSYGVFAGGAGLDSSGFTLENASNVGKVAQKAGGQGFAGTQATIATQAGKTYRLTTRVRVTANAPDMSDSKAFLSVIGFNSANSYFWASNTAQQITAADGWMTITALISGDAMLSQGVVAFRAMVAVNRTYAGVSLASTSQIQFIKVEDAGLQSAVDPSTTGYSYDKLGRLRIFTDPSGRKSHYLYDALGRKVADIAADGAIVEYGYDAASRLIKTIRYATKLSAGQLASLVDASGNPANVTLASVRPASNAADGWEWRIYDNADRLIETIDGKGDATVFEYDGGSRLVKTSSYANVIAAATVTGYKTTTPTTLQLPTADAAKDNVSRSFYDNAGRLVGALDGAGYLSQIVYNEAGDKVETIAFANITTQSLRASGTFEQLLSSVGINARDIHNRYFYDNRGFLRYTLDATLRPTEYVYDADGHVLHSIEYGGSIGSTASYTLAYVQGQISSTGLSTNANNRTSWSVYDAAGRLAFAIDALGGVTGYSYDALGRVIKQTEYSWLTTLVADPSLATMQNWATGHAADAGNRVSRLVYDALGQVAYEVDAEGYVTEHQYDAAGRVTKNIRYASAYAVADGVTKAGLAAQIGALPADAVVTSYSYDPIGRLSDTYDALGVRTHIDYDALDRVTDRTVAYGTADAATTHYSYDAAGRVASETRGYGAAEASTTSFSYDGLGNLLSKTDGRNYTTSYSYDAMGRVLTTTVPLDASTNAVTTNSYDAFGNLISQQDPRGNVGYFTYDLLNRLVWQVDPEGYATYTSYTIGDEVASVTRYAVKVTGAGPALVPTVTAAPGDDATTSFTRDKLGRVTAVTDAMGYVESYQLNAFGNRTRLTNKLGGITDYTYDKLGRLRYEWVNATATRADGSVQANGYYKNIYDYDARGNVVRQVEAYGLTERRNTYFTYDKLDHLLTTTGDVVQVVDPSTMATSNVTPTETRVYDLRGNLVKATDATGASSWYYYDDLGRKIAEVNAVGTLSAWTYDANGNALTARVYGDAVALPTGAGGNPPAPVNGSNYRETSFAYDRNNRLTTTTIANVRVGAWNGTSYATTPQSIVTTNQYDAAGNIIKQTDARGNSAFFFYNKNGQKIAQADQENYFTSYTLDGDGNVLSETRYANRLAATPTAGVLPANPAADATNDRTTSFTYDRNGRRLTETRTGVVAWTVNATNGALTQASTSATIAYTYNGLGEVLTKQEANGDTTTYSYDAMGRLTLEQGPVFTDYAGVNVQRYVQSYYDGLNNLTRTVQNAVRTTTYTYGAGGRLASMTDASGFSTSYYYDAAGRLTGEAYSRLRSDGTPIGEAKSYAYDALGRSIAQRSFVNMTTYWALTGDTTQTRYNAYGDLTAKGLNGLWQETFDYDNAGRVWRSTAGDGVAKIYLYDANGNQSLAITSSGGALPAGYSWSTLTTDQAVNLLTSNGASTIGAVNVAGMVVTITAYDKRNQNLETREPLRETTAIGTATTLISHKRGYNAFGEVIQETDARNYVTDFAYNTMGKLIQKQSPTVAWTAENGAIANARPTENYYYDLSGRLVGVRDANNNLNTRSLLAGTGFGGEEALVLKEFHADTGVSETRYDVFGDARYLINEIGKVESRSYDAMGRLTTLGRPQRADGTQLWESYAYDGLGQRIRHWNSQLTSSVMERTDYDAQGRVTSMVSYGGDTTTYSYSWNGSLITAGLGSFGGWTKTTVNAAAKTMTEQTDYFGRTVDKIDYGNHDYSYSFDSAGRLVTTTLSGDTINYSWYNSGLMAGIVSDDYAVSGPYTTDIRRTTTYRYDAQGQRTYEGYAGSTYLNGTLTSSQTYQDATVTWDSNGRMLTFTDTAYSTEANDNVSIVWEYDLGGNIRRVNATYRIMDDTGAFTAGTLTQDYWYKYDSMNRFVTTKGQFSGTRGSGTITRGEALYSRSAGTDIAYDLTGQRISATRTIVVPNQYFSSHYERREIYSYSADGYLAGVNQVEGASAITTNPVPAAPSGGTTQAVYTRDAMGRVTSLTEFEPDGTTVSYTRALTYNNRSQILTEVVSTYEDDDSSGERGVKWDTSTYYYDDAYNGTGAYLGGAVTRIATERHQIEQDGDYDNYDDTDTRYTYSWWDGAKQAGTTYDKDTGSSSNSLWTTTLSYDGFGRLTQARVLDGRDRTLTYVTDAEGTILRRNEDFDSTTDTPREAYYMFDGIRVGDISNSGTSNIDYVQTIENRYRIAAGSGVFDNGATSNTVFADFDQSYDPITGLSYQATASRSGDNLMAVLPSVIGQTVGTALAEGVASIGAPRPAEDPRLEVDLSVLTGDANVTGGGTNDPTLAAQVNSGAAQEAARYATAKQEAAQAESGYEGGEIVVTADKHRSQDYSRSSLSDAEFSDLRMRFGQDEELMHLATHAYLDNRNAQYWRSVTGGQSLSSYTPSLWMDYKQAVWGREDQAYALWHAGGLGYLGAPIEFALSPVTAALDLGSSYYRGRYGRIAPADRQATDITLFGLGGVEAMASKVGRVGLAAEGAPLSIEAQFQANSLRLADEGHGIFTQGVANGDIVLNPKLSMDIQRGNFVDGFIRRGNLTLRDELGLDATTVRINQRLYAPGGKYTVPDLHFPGSGNSIDYSYQHKNATTPQITRIQRAAPNGTITIVPPAAIRPVYTIRP
jgi:YD repeat-containing protein